MFKLFKRTPLYIKVYKNKIEITNLLNRETVSKNAIEKFSTERIIVSKFQPALKLISEILVEMKLYRRYLPYSFNILVQQMTKFDDEFSDIEKRAYRDLCEQVGANEVHLISNHEKLTIEQATIEIKRKDNY